MTELLFREDPYLAACEARVVAVRDGAVELDRTVFYPKGGEQPDDTGRIGAWRVLDLQACGGTHVRNTAEIGALAVAKIRSEGRRNKRVTLVLT
ncbi:MAG: hypothetical protein A3G81_06285 [Betaproteobacteria bacterium RIFCSPLOWO2_12_FULL_65_14]|nr:MAG: hypothetical protein A3G81_06285 [Betaproteobacteria bacterium RIFCSPLOWO2_12_FULL_65_14]